MTHLIGVETSIYIGNESQLIHGYFYVNINKITTAIMIEGLFVPVVIQRAACIARSFSGRSTISLKCNAVYIYKFSEKETVTSPLKPHSSVKFPKCEPTTNLSTTMRAERLSEPIVESEDLRMSKDNRMKL